MATETQNDITVTASWTDATVGNGDLADADVILQNVGAGQVFLVWGGASAPTNKTGARLKPGDSFQGNASNIWLSGSGKVSVALI